MKPIKTATSAPLYWCVIPCPFFAISVSAQPHAAPQATSCPRVQPCPGFRQAPAAVPGVADPHRTQRRALGAAGHRLPCGTIAGRELHRAGPRLPGCSSWAGAQAHVSYNCFAGVMQVVILAGACVHKDTVIICAACH